MPQAKLFGRLGADPKKDEALENTCIMALANLSEGNVGQEVLREQGGMDVFATTLRQGPAADGAMDSVLAIGHMSLDNKENQNSLREAGAFEALTEMLRHSHSNPEYYEMMEACLKSLHNMLTGNQENQVGPIMCSKTSHESHPPLRCRPLPVAHPSKARPLLSLPGRPTLGMLEAWRSFQTFLRKA